MNAAEERQIANIAILDEVNQAGTWFLAKKTRPIWAKRAERDQTVETLEGAEQVNVGDFLCRGEAGDVWPQTAERLQAKYMATDEMSEDGWRKYVPHPDAKGVMAAQVDHPFVVNSAWGELSGKAGDYIVKNYEDHNASYPRDVWIVDRRLFQDTYEPVDSSE